MKGPLTSTLRLPQHFLPSLPTPTRVSRRVTALRGSLSRRKELTPLSPALLGLMALMGLLVVLDPLARRVQQARLALLALRARRATRGMSDPREIRETLVRKGFRVTQERTEPTVRPDPQDLKE